MLPFLKWSTFVNLHKPMILLIVFLKKYDTYIEQGGANVSGGQKAKTMYC